MSFWLNFLAIISSTSLMLSSVHADLGRPEISFPATWSTLSIFFTPFSFHSCSGWSLTQRTQTSLRRLQDVLKRLRRLEKDVWFTTSWGRLIYVVLKTSNLRPLQDVWFTKSWRRRLRHFETSNLGCFKNVWFTMSSGRLIYDVLKTSDLRRLEDVQFTTSWGGIIYDVFRTSGLRSPEDVWFT